MVVYRKILENSKFIIGFILIFSCVCLTYLDQLKVKYDISEYFPEGDTTYEDYLFFTQAFDYDDDKIWVAVTDKNSIFINTFINKCSDFQSKIEALPDVIEVHSILSLKEKIKTPLGIVNIPLIHSDPFIISRDSAKIMSDSRIVGNFIAKNANSIAFYLVIDRQISEKRLDYSIESLIKLCDDSEFDATYLAGDRYTKYIFKNTIRNEILINMMLCVAVIIIFLFFTLRSAWGIVLLLMNSAFSVIIFFGIIGFINGSLGIMSNYYPVILLIIGLTTGIHIVIKYENENKIFLNPHRAILIALGRVGYTTSLSALTTSIGFLSLNISPIYPIRQFGNEAALCVIISYLVSILFIPAMIATFKIPGRSLIHAKYHFWSVFSARLADYIRYKEKLILLSFSLVLIFSIIGIRWISIDNYLINTTNKSKLHEEREFFETNYGGLRNLEIIISALPPSEIKKLENIVFFNKFELYLSNLKSVSNVISPATIYKSINKTFNGGQSIEYKLPTNQEIFEKYNKYSYQSSAIIRSFLSENNQAGRISARVKDIGRNAANNMHNEIINWFERNKKDLNLSINITGIPILIDKTHEIMVKDLYKSLLIAFTIVSILFGSIFLNVKYVIISWIVNLIPLAIAAGFMGVFSIPLIASTSIIFPIGYVIAVDDTIHFISNYELNKKLNKSANEALILTLNDTGKAMVLTSIILIAGFSILIFSEFDVLHYNGILVCIIITFALLADILLIAIMIKYLNRIKLH